VHLVGFITRKLNKNVNANNTLVAANQTPADVTKEMGIQFRMQIPVLKKTKE
jgi:hypothetical protein